MSLQTFAQNKLKITIWPKMEEIFRAVESGERKILVRSCNGAGKTTALAAICNWYFKTYKDAIVLTTASSWTQVSRNLWGEIRKQARRASLYPKSAMRSKTDIHLSDKHFMLGISPNIPENAMGFHAPHMLIAVDEATGVSHEIMDALTGNMSACDAQIVMICNPIDRESYPYQAEMSGEWKVIEISAFDHPNVDKGIVEIPGAVTRDWISDRVRSWTYPVSLPAEDELLAKQERLFYIPWEGTYYRKTAIAQARILGEWAQLTDEGFIPLELIERNVMRDEYEPADGAVTMRAMGVDISRGVWRDLTVYATFDVRDGAPDVQTNFQTFENEDLMVTAERIKTEYELCKQEGIELVVALDDTGVGGGVTDRLKQLEVPVFPVNFASGPQGFLPGKPLANARAEMYFVLQRELLEGKILLRNFPQLHRELSAIHLDISALTGGYKMESKFATVRRLGRSPDYADATALARYGLRLHAHTKKEKFI